jgi:hypothetical protein
VRGTLEQFIAEENGNLLQRNEAMDGTRRWLVGAILAALAGAAILGVSLLGRSRQDITILARNQTELRSQNETLEAAVRERTQALEVATARMQSLRRTGGCGLAAISKRPMRRNSWARCWTISRVRPPMQAR